MPTRRGTKTSKKKTAKKTSKTKKRKSPFGGPKKDDTFDFDIPEDIEERGGRIPAGQYPGKCVGVRKDVSSSGNNMWVWDVVITKGKHAGRDFIIYTALTDASLWKVQETLMAFGIDAAPGVSGSFSKKDVIGVLVTLVIEDDTYQGRKQSKCNALLPYEGGVGKRSKKGGRSFPPDEPDEEEEEGEEEEEEEEEE